MAEFLAELAAASPNLRGANCTDPAVRSLFDRAAVGAAAVAVPPALAVCSRCPVLEQCRAWVMSLPHDLRPRGVVGGLVVNPRLVACSVSGSGARPSLRKVPQFLE